ncbi:GntR family transcriptional regulator [Arcanobacterium ihumii]|uniref:GntR family transcriptional regulator n=1 Tax=Arcanobacterium ihumii TaxID=2138162 RepID=UPI000F52B0E2|nr:GntR family transcriptional regulator [Arcanobacterium ihumii]
MNGVPRIADELASHLRDRIISGTIRPGTQLAEASLATEYDVSRPTARTAVDLLVADGLLIRKPHLPPQVPQISSQDLREIIALLETCESLALEIAFHNEVDPRPLRRSITESANQVLHTLVKSCGSERLTQIHRRCTFELMLTDAQSWKADNPAVRSLVDAVATFEFDLANESLGALQKSRHSVLDRVEAVSL